MGKHIVEIGNSDGQSLIMSLVVSGDPEECSWQTLNKGCISHNRGYIKKTSSDGTLTTRHILLFSSKNKWGIRLNDFEDFWGANDKGDGILVQPWELTFKSGVISWELVE